MHRSGTSLAAAMLASLGVYVDPRMPPPREGEVLMPPTPEQRTAGYGEAEAFRLLNEHVMRLAGARWHHPEPFLLRRDRPMFSAVAVGFLRLAARGSLRRDFLTHAPPDCMGAWGWKDPRTSLTWPLWRRVFPDACVLHVCRDTAAVARSVLRREQIRAISPPPLPTAGARAAELLRDPEAALRHVARRISALVVRTSPAPSLDTERCAHLQRLHVEQASAARDVVPHYMEVAYEDILCRPEDAARRLARFAGLEPESWRVAQAVALVQDGAPSAAQRHRPAAGSA